MCVLLLVLILVAVVPAQAEVPAGLRCLQAAYPEQVLAVSDKDITMRDGTVLPWNDGKPKSFEQKLAAPDLEDMFSQPYPRAWSDQPPQRNFDPGRIRSETLFGAMYGRTDAEVRRHLVAVRWLPAPGRLVLWVTTVNGVDKALARVAAELATLPPALRHFVDHPAGGFAWRSIAGTNQYSAHGYGIAVDMNVASSDYWRWSGRPIYRNRMPREVVEIFERNGFIWGGRWYHFDTMHFEYRPELFCSPVP